MRIVNHFFYLFAILVLTGSISTSLHGTYAGEHENGSSYILVLEEGDSYTLTITEDNLNSHFSGNYHVEANKLILTNAKVTVVDKRVKKPTISDNNDVIVFIIKGEELWDVKNKICLKRKN